MVTVYVQFGLTVQVNLCLRLQITLQVMYTYSSVLPLFAQFHEDS